MADIIDLDDYRESKAMIEDMLRQVAPTLEELERLTAIEFETRGLQAGWRMYHEVNAMLEKAVHEATEACISKLKAEWEVG